MLIWEGPVLAWRGWGGADLEGANADLGGASTDL